MREFEQLQMRFGLDEESELEITGLIKGLSPNIANVVDLQPYISFHYVFNVVIKVEKQLKD